MKAVIFDVDGTLYHQRKLRLFLISDMVLSVLRAPATYGELKIVRDFRKAREALGNGAAGRIERRQYEWGAGRSHVSAVLVRRAVQRWMLERPLRYLPYCRFEDAAERFAELRAAGIRIGVFSDYPAREKLQVLGLQADAVVSATDEDVDRLKPAPEGLCRTAEKLGIPVGECLFIGDRDDKDGECARRAGMPYLVLKHPGRFFSAAGTADMTAAWRNSWKR